MSVMRILSENEIKCGEVNKPTRSPLAAYKRQSMPAVDPLPLVPPITTEGVAWAKPPRSEQASFTRSNPGFTRLCRLA